jgi:hypothetical protein
VALFLLSFVFFVACCAHGALACQEKARAVLTGLWKLCARMLPD